MELKDYLRVIRVRKWIIIIAVVVTTAATVGASLMQPRVYEGKVNVAVAQNAGSALLGTSLGDLTGQSERGLQTQAQLIQQWPVAELAIKKLGLRVTLDDLMERTKVTAVGQTNVVTIVVTDTSPERAAATAQALATSYVEWSRDRKRASITSASNEVQARLDEAKAAILTLGAKLKGGNSSALNAQLKDATAEQAALVDTLVGLRVSQQSQTLPAQIEVTKARIAATERQLTDLRAKIVDLGSRLGASGDASKNYDVQAELQIATGLYTTLAEKYETLKVSEQLEVGPADIVAPARVDTEPVSPKPLRNGVLALVVGLVFGLGIAFLAEYLDKSIKSAEEAQDLFGAPVLGNIPTEQLDGSGARLLTIVTNPGSRAAEAYRGLRNSIDFVNFENDIKTVLVTSAAPAEGKSTVSANLAASLAMAGARVVLLNCDFRRPTTDQFFTLNNMLGLSDVLAGRASLQSALQDTGDDKLRILTAGRMPPNPSELLGSEKMIELVDALRKEYDWVIVDSPPLLAVADAAATARWTDGVLVVTRAGVSTHPAAAHARDILEKVGARILGVVVWGLDESRSRRGGYGGYYGGYYSAYTVGSKANGFGGGTDSGARSTLTLSAAESSGSVAHSKSSFTQWFTSLGGFWLGGLAFALVLALMVGLVWLLDWQLGWGLMGQVGGLWS